MPSNPSIIYGTPKLDIKDRIEHLCYHGCRLGPVDTESGHVVGFWCKKITIASGLSYCDYCEREYIDKTKYQDPNYETPCLECVIKHDL